MDTRTTDPNKAQETSTTKQNLNYSYPLRYPLPRNQTETNPALFFPLPT